MKTKLQFILGLVACVTTFRAPINVDQLPQEVQAIMDPQAAVYNMGSNGFLELDTILTYFKDLASNANYPTEHRHIQEYNFVLVAIQDKVPGYFNSFQTLENNTISAFFMKEVKRFLLVYQGFVCLAYQELRTVRQYDLDGNPNRASELLKAFFARFNPALQSHAVHSPSIGELIPHVSRPISEILRDLNERVSPENNL